MFHSLKIIPIMELVNETNIEFYRLFTTSRMMIAEVSKSKLVHTLIINKYRILGHE